MGTSNPASGFPATRPRIIPVIDVMDGRVVRAVGGRRSEYQPVRSALTDSTEPVAVAHAMLQATDADELYAADLDAIQHGTLAVSSWSLSARVPGTLILDAGGQAPSLYAPRVRRVVPSEVVATPEEARQLASRSGHPAGPVFSLDLDNGLLRGNWRRWGAADPTDWRTVIRRAYHVGFRSFIVLDLAHVGTEQGSGTGELCRTIRDEYPAVEIITGGGVRSWADVQQLADAGADAVLVASALHDGSLTLPRPAS